MQEVETTVRDSFTSIAPYYDQLMAGVPYKFWVSYLDALWKTHGQTPKRVLDLACGTGTVSLMLAKKGINVVGIDKSAEMIEIAQKKARSILPTIQFQVGDATKMAPIQSRVDTVICLFDSLNNILEPNDLLEAMRTVRGSIRDGGLFIFDLNTAYAFRQGMFNQRSSVMDEPLHYSWRSRFDESTQLCTITMDFEVKAHGLKPTRKFTEIHIQRAYSRLDIEDMLKEAGFATITEYDAYTLFKPKKRSDRIFWVAE